MHINASHKYLNNSNAIHLADDTLIYSAQNVDEAINILNNDLSNVYYWFDIITLQVNVDKLH